MLLGGLSALGVGLGLAAINVRFRDVSRGLPFLVQTWMFASPVAYPLSTIPAGWQSVYQLNPMVGVIEGARWALLPGQTFDPLLLVPSVCIGVLLLLAGLTCYAKSQRGLADLV